jgi:hypothetical protein
MKTNSIVQLFVFVFLGMFWTVNSFAQQDTIVLKTRDTTNYLVIKNDGTEFIGQILSDDGRELLLLTKNIGKVYISKSSIKSIRSLSPTEDYKNGEFNSVGVFTTRYQFTTNCFPIKKGENYAMINLYGPEVHFAVTDDFSVGVMSTWIGSPLALAFKYTRKTANPKWNVGLGSLIGTSGYINQGRGFGGLYWGMVTYGDRRSNVTLSLGYGHFNSGNNQQVTIYEPGTYPYDNWVYPEIPIKESYVSKSIWTAPIIGIAGQTKVGKRTSLIYDCMILLAQEKMSKPDGFQSKETIFGTNGSNQIKVNNFIPYSNIKQNAIIIMPGMRFQKTDEKAFQISLAGVISSDGSFPLPMASWFYRF